VIPVSDPDPKPECVFPNPTRPKSSGSGFTTLRPQEMSTNSSIKHRNEWLTLSLHDADSFLFFLELPLNSLISAIHSIDKRQT
jgi:hypothetical protein